MTAKANTGIPAFYFFVLVIIMRDGCLILKRYIFQNYVFIVQPYFISISLFYEKLQLI